MTDTETTTTTTEPAATLLGGSVVVDSSESTSSTSTTSTEAVVKKGRGRPRKYPAVEKPKSGKGRGRPRKNPDEPPKVKVLKDKIVDENGATPTKGKRGRPRKVVTEKTSEENQTDSPTSDS
eukprot:TRINITY_DN5659_c0_g1_i1.p1 TRINITY_DN5659_c0_g1~~TRINITY_DN5659_c0_g1_i1.p1  ORF type:complete len:122 (-),score=30.87 TRINITY_DN5659_c0_g1_i1:92-457(-)